MLVPVKNSAVRVANTYAGLQTVVTSSPGQISIQFATPNPIPNNHPLFTLSNQQLELENGLST
jgi:hypothetical protein